MKRPEPREFHYKEAHFHIVTDCWDTVTERILSERNNLEAFISRHEEFRTSLVPLPSPPSGPGPDSVTRMLWASEKTGLGPMAAVAGTMAQIAAEVSIGGGSGETIIENGGDLYIHSHEEVVIGLYSGSNGHFPNLALKILPGAMPLAVCSSSSRMGHSLSFGDCDLVTVFSENASLADAAATLGCNSVKSNRDIEPVLNRLMDIAGVQGALIIRDDQFGAVGVIPELIKSLDPLLSGKISRDDLSGF